MNECLANHSCIFIAIENGTPTVRLLKRRFGSVDDVLAARIQGLEIEQLEALGEALLDFTALNDLLNRYSEP